MWTPGRWNWGRKISRRCSTAGAAPGGDPARELVRVIDEDIDAEVSASAIRYGATSRVLSVLSEDAPAKLQQRARGELRLAAGSEAEMNLGTGVGVARGPAELVAGDSSAEKPRSIAWKDQADVILATRNGSLGQGLTEAIFRGAVVAREGRVGDEDRLGAGRFRICAARRGSPESALARVEARGNVEAHDSGGGSLAADELTMALESVGKNTDPSELAAHGKVRAARDGWTLSCEDLDVALARSVRGEIVVTTATAPRT